MSTPHCPRPTWERVYGTTPDQVRCANCGRTGRALHPYRTGADGWTVTLDPLNDEPAAAVEPAAL